MASKYYVVWQGRTPGIYTDWNSCKAQTEKFAGARYKSFKTKAEADAAYSGESPPVKSGETKTKTKAASKSTNKGIKTYSAKEIEALDYDFKIFTDGGCEPNPGEAGSGVALYKDGKVHELWYGLYEPLGTNNTAELNALHQALLMAETYLSKNQSVAIFCDSKYSIQCVIQWAAGWEKNGWKKKGGDIKNLELIKEMFTLYQSLKGQLQILHVNGHVGVEGNELADRMSILAIELKDVHFVQYQEDVDIEKLLAMRNG